jgi:hypothetical protein
VNRPDVLTTPMDVLLALGARVSPDLDAYASGRLDISQVRCVLCGEAPCRCRQCEAPYQGYLAPEPRTCGMTLGSAPGLAPDECPRGHRAGRPR